MAVPTAPDLTAIDKTLTLATLRLRNLRAAHIPDGVAREARLIDALLDRRLALARRG